MLERRQVTGTVLAGSPLLAGSVLAGTLAGTVQTPAAAASASTPSVSTLYREAIATTRSWSVHYASSSIQSKVTLLESGDAGPASGTQTVLTGKGSPTDNATIDVIGGITYREGQRGWTREPGRHERGPGDRRRGPVD